ncbi:MAG: hypothetical protein Q9213_003607 [Squamulea squamosa]
MCRPVAWVRLQLCRYSRIDLQQLLLHSVTLFSLVDFTLALPSPSTPAELPAVPITPLSTRSVVDTRSPRLNCDGSLWCSIYGLNFTHRAYEIATTGMEQSKYLDSFWNLGPMNDTAFYATGHHALCMPDSLLRRTGYCVFAQYSPAENAGVTGREVKAALKALVEAGCKMCGSVPMAGGGWITANYVNKGVCGGVCRETRYI